MVLKPPQSIVCVKLQNKIDNEFTKQGIAETAKTNGPTCDNMCIQKI